MLINEPVAWMNPSQVLHGVIDARTYRLEGFIPLYTHPAKTLTDEEIYALWEEFNGEIKNFARAILRKAQEK